VLLSRLFYKLTFTLEKKSDLMWFIMINEALICPIILNAVILIYNIRRSSLVNLKAFIQIAVKNKRGIIFGKAILPFATIII
jgi:hypothetical protein